MLKTIISSPTVFGTFFNVTSLFIAACLTCFLMLGCVSTASSFSSIYFIEYSYNEDSPFYNLVKSGYKNGTLATMKIRAGYLGICGLTGENSTDAITCVGRANWQQLEHVYHNLSIYIEDNNSSPIASFDPVSLASTFSNHIMSPVVVILMLIIAVVAFIVSVTRVILRFSPTASLILRKANLGVSIAGTIVCFVQGVWVEVAIRSSTYLTGQTSASVLQAVRGTRSEGMIWTSWVFFVISMTITSVETVQALRLANRSKERI